MTSEIKVGDAVDVRATVVAFASDARVLVENHHRPFTNLSGWVEVSACRKVEPEPAPKPEPVCWVCDEEPRHHMHVYGFKFDHYYAPERRIATSDRRKGPGEDARKVALDVLDALEAWEGGRYKARIALRTALRAEDNNLHGRVRIRRACDRRKA